MKRLSWPGVIVVAASTMLSWLNTPPVVRPIAQPREPIESETTANGIAPTAASIAGMRLHNWSPPASPARGRADRDIFTFKRPPARPAAPEPSRGLPATGDAAQPPPVQFKLIGFAEDTGPDGAIRTAIISGQGQLYLVKEGEAVGSNYRVVEILPESVELLDRTGGARLRLALK